MKRRFLAWGAGIIFLLIILRILTTPAFFAEASVGSALRGFFDFFNPSTSSSLVTPSSPPPVALSRPAADYEKAVVDAVDMTAPAVISIVITKNLPVIENCPVDPFADLPPELRRFFGPSDLIQPCAKGTKPQEIGGGSGFIVSDDGLVLTNRHVVADTEAAYTILTNDGKKYNAKVLARDPVQDLALVQILSPGKKLPTVHLGVSSEVKLGQTAIAIGNALGEFRNTVSAGIISGLARTIVAEGGDSEETLEGVIQTDAAINPGNSGGPLLNLHGEVIGVNTAVAAGAQNIGFAIPIDKAKQDIESVQKLGRIAIPYLGIRYVMITDDLRTREKISVTEGALVRGGAEGPAIVPGSPAAKAGILGEDIIIAVGNENVTVDRSLASILQNYHVGDSVQIKIIRGTKQLTVIVTLGERP